MPKLAETILRGNGALLDELRRGLESGAEAIMGSYRPEFITTLQRLRGAFEFAVYPVVPNAPIYVRDLADLGMARTAIKRLQKLPATGWMRLAAYGTANVLGVLGQDFGTMLGVMVHLELPAFLRFRPPVVFLHPQMTDLLLACRNRAAFQAYAAVIRRYGAEPGLVTRNFGHLVPRLTEWGVGISTFVAPFNCLGYGMRPSQRKCEALLATGGADVVAEEILANGAVQTGDALQYARVHSFQSVVLRGNLVSQWRVP